MLTDPPASGAPAVPPPIDARRRFEQRECQRRQQLEHQLHNQVGQPLSAMILQLALIRHRVDSGLGVEELIDTAQRALRTTIDELRAVERAVYPWLLTHSGLAAATAAAAEQAGVPLLLQAAPDVRFDPSAEAAAYFALAACLRAARGTTVPERLHVVIHHDSSTEHKSLLVIELIGAPSSYAELMCEHVWRLDGTVAADHRSVTARIPCG